jgi:hypothetical protein
MIIMIVIVGVSEYLEIVGYIFRSVFSQLGLHFKGLCRLKYDHINFEMGQKQDQNEIGKQKRKCGIQEKDL